MADLPTVADRMNDIEISANAGLSETLLRRLGSNINYLLDFLNITDGDTTPGGAGLEDFFNAIGVVQNHTLTLQLSNPGNGTHTVGSYAQIPFVDHVFYAENMNVGVSPGASTGSRVVPTISFNGGSSFTYINASVNTPSNTQLFGAGTFQKFPDTTTNSVGVAATKNSAEPYARAFDAAIGVTGFEHRMRSEQWTILANVSWKDMSSTQNMVLRYYNEGGNNAFGDPMRVWLGYRLNLESQFLVAP